MKRHCMIVYAPYPLGETRVQREAEALVRHGHAVDVICIRLPGEPARDEYNGVRIYREPYRTPLKLPGLGELGERFFKYLRFFFHAGWRVTWLHLTGGPEGQRGYDSLQAHNLPDFLVFCALAPRLMGAPALLDLHDLMPEFFIGRFGDPHALGAVLIRWQERWACRFASHVITVSEHWRQALIGRGVPPEKCSVVMNVADERIFTPPAVSTRPPAESGAFRLIYHGSIHYRYGLDLAVQAVAQLRAAIPGIHLTLVGAGSALADVQQQAQRLGLQAQVDFMPLLLAEELPAIIAGCHLGVVPYRSDVFTDGLLPTKLMEYAALGLPAAAARTPAIVDYFSDANTEFFEPGSADDLAQTILRLYHNPQRLAELAEGSRKFNQRYNWARIGADYVALVERLQQSAGSKPLAAKRGGAGPFPSTRR